MTADTDNARFWNELCGSNAARAIGVTDASPGSLKKWDDWYFGFYPYLLEHVALGDLKGRDVLEIGLGYSSLSQKLAESGAHYTGLDVAVGPVAMLEHRLSQSGLPGQAVQGSILSAPFPDQSFDRVVAIGCLHHTGDLARSIAECRRLLRPGGELVLMVYNAYSYRRWIQAPTQTLRYLAAEARGYRGVVRANRAAEKWDYDHNAEGEAAPHTDFISVRSLRALCSDFRAFTGRLRNINREPPFIWRTREQLLLTRWPDRCGLDIYATATK